MKCLECGKELKQISFRHLQSCCKLTPSEYKKKHNVQKLMDKDVVAKCSKTGKNNGNWKGGKTKKKVYCSCGKEITGRGKSGLCIVCSKSGTKNGFYGKKHSQQTKKLLSKRMQQRILEKPETLKYGVPTKQQSIDAAKKLWDNMDPLVRKKRIDKFIEAGQKANKNCKFTKIERIIAKFLDENGVSYRWNHKIEHKWVDFLVEDVLVVEAYGDYWHCNPDVYAENYYQKDLHMTSKEKWELDLKRQKKIESLGFEFFVLWEKDIKKNYSNSMAKLLEKIYNINRKNI